MGSGSKGLYSGAYTGNNSTSKTEPQNGTDYNTAGSTSIGNVTSISSTHDVHSVPVQGTPNSVSRNYRDGHLNSERYYDSDGNAYLDIDYTNHGNPNTHPHVPHEHAIHFDADGKMHRDNEPEGGIRK